MVIHECFERYRLLQTFDIWGWQRRFPGHEEVPWIFARGILERSFQDHGGMAGLEAIRRARGIVDSGYNLPPWHHQVRQLLEDWERHPGSVLLLRAPRAAVFFGAKPDKPRDSAPVQSSPPPVDLRLRVETFSGDPVDDDAGFSLVMPDGSVESAKLSGGEYRKSGITGTGHRATFKYLATARWGTTSLRYGEAVTLSVAAPGFADGAQVTFKVYDESHPDDADAWAVLSASVLDGRAQVIWTPTQEAGMAARLHCVFEVEAQRKWVSSPPASLVSRPMSELDLGGVKERLTQLGYDCGAPGPEASDALTQALKDFQGSFGVDQPTGNLTETTLMWLEELS